MVLWNKHATYNFEEKASRSADTLSHPLIHPVWHEYLKDFSHTVVFYDQICTISVASTVLDWEKTRPIYQGQASTAVWGEQLTIFAKIKCNTVSHPLLSHLRWESMSLAQIWLWGPRFWPLYSHTYILTFYILKKLVCSLWGPQIFYSWKCQNRSDHRSWSPSHI